MVSLRNRFDQDTSFIGCCTTGSGKSVGVNTMLVSMLLRHSPETLRLILVDPKMLEFEMYNNILTSASGGDRSTPSVVSCGGHVWRWTVGMGNGRVKIRNVESYNKRLTEELSEWDQSKAVYYAPDNWDGKSNSKAEEDALHRRCN